MKNFIRLRSALIIVYVFLSQLLFAQSNYVEVTVSDTLIVKANEFIYRLNYLMDQSSVPFDTSKMRDLTYAAKRSDLIRQKANESFKDLQTKIKNEGFILLPISLNEAFNKYGNNIQNLALVVDIPSLDQLFKFYGLIKNDKNIQGGIQVAKLKDEVKYIHILYKKLLLKARSEANYLAGLNNKKIVALASISENRFGYSNIPIYQPNTLPLASVPVINLDDKLVSIGVSLQNSITVKYLWK
jgi:hypothetical protein